MIIQEYEVEVDGGTLFAKSWVPAKSTQGPPVVLLHDSLGCVALWRDFPEVLADRIGRTVIAYDRLGFGQSTPQTGEPSGEFIKAEAPRIECLLDSLGVNAAVLFGYSVGGPIAIATAASMSDRVAAVITESAQAFVEDRTLAGVEAARIQFSDANQVARLRKWHGERAEWILSAWIDVWTSSAYAHWTLEDILPRVTCPILAIHGDLDEFGSFAFPRMITGLSKGANQMLLLQNCGHMPHRERREDVLQAVEEFLHR